MKSSVLIKMKTKTLLYIMFPHIVEEEYELGRVVIMNERVLSGLVCYFLLLNEMSFDLYFCLCVDETCKPKLTGKNITYEHLL